jgi:hypothetical protein
MLSDAVTVVTSSAMTALKSRYADFTTTGKTFVTKLANALKTGKGELSSAGKTAAGQAVSGARSKYSSMYDAGEYIAKGLMNGMYVWKNAVYYKGYELGQAAVDGVNDGADNNSPSKETYQSGIWVGEGLVNGVYSMGDRVYKAGRAVGRDAITGVATSISNISKLIESGIDAQPTIRPVMDLSDVRTGVAAIDGLLGTSTMLGLSTTAGAVGTMMSRRSQNGANHEVVAAIDKLRKDLGNVGNTTYNVNGVTYDDGSNVSNAVQELVRAARIERRI